MVRRDATWRRRPGQQRRNVEGCTRSRGSISAGIPGGGFQHRGHSVARDAGIRPYSCSSVDDQRQCCRVREIAGCAGHGNGVRTCLGSYRWRRWWHRRSATAADGLQREEQHDARERQANGESLPPGTRHSREHPAEQDHQYDDWECPRPRNNSPVPESRRHGTAGGGRHHHAGGLPRIQRGRIHAARGSLRGRSAADGDLPCESVDGVDGDDVCESGGLAGVHSLRALARAHGKRKIWRAGEGNAEWIRVTTRSQIPDVESIRPWATAAYGWHKGELRRTHERCRNERRGGGAAKKD